VPGFEGFQKSPVAEDLQLLSNLRLDMAVAGVEFGEFRFDTLAVHIIGSARRKRTQMIPTIPTTALEWLIAAIAVIVGFIYAFDGWTSTGTTKSIKDSPRLKNLKYALGGFLIALIADFDRFAQLVKLSPAPDKLNLLLIYVGWFLIAMIGTLIAVSAVIEFRFFQLQRTYRGFQFSGIHPMLTYAMYGFKRVDSELKAAREEWVKSRERFMGQFLPDYYKQLTEAIVAVSDAGRAANPETSRVLAESILKNVEAVVTAYNAGASGLTMTVNYMRAQPAATAEETTWNALRFGHGRREDYQQVLILEQYAGDRAPAPFVLPVWKSDGGKEHILPGAPQAFFNNGDVLVNDTQKDLEFPRGVPEATVKEIKEYFAQKSIRSFLSLTIIGHGAIRGVLNVDANQPGVFGREKQAQEEIRKMLKPFCHLLGFLIRT
jgi:hypothetical protein